MKWGLNSLGIVLLLAFCASLAVSLALWTRLSRAKQELAATEAAESAARAKQERRLAEEARPAAQVASPVVEPQQPEIKPERLVLLLTVGTQHYAEKQMRLLQPKCPQAKLRVYQQRKGRCGWSTCFAVAAREEDEERTRSCGATRGQALRDAKDFVIVR
jgi:hypothetical protein